MKNIQLVYDEPIKISPLVTRILADNSSYMTGPGTNTYLIGHDEIAVIDPGPYDNRHLNAIMNSVIPPSKIKWIFVSHSHPDHAPGADLLRNETGAPILSLTSHKGRGQDFHSKQGRVLHHEERVQTSEFSLQMIHTPGHASNHLCILLENEKLLFSGDHIMQGSTVVIIPPSGHMKSYLNSLESLKKYDIDNIAPGHGHIIDTPFEEIDDIIVHRLQREAKVLSALKQYGHASVDQLVPSVYDDVPTFKHFVAAFSLEAHLIKLEEDGVVDRGRSVWRLKK